MKPIKKTVTLLFPLILLSTFSFALTFDELVSSYEYNLSSSSIDITNISVINCVNCENITVNLLIQSDIGDYEIYGFFDNKTSSTSKHFFEQNNSIPLTFFPPFSNNESSLWVKITSNDNIIFFSNVSEIDISSFHFKIPNISVINETEEDGKLKLTLHIEPLMEGSYELTSHLTSNNQTFLSIQDEELNLTNNISLIFDTGVDGEFTLTTVELNESAFNLDYKTKNYSFSRIKFVNDSIIEGNLAINVSIKNHTNYSFYLFDSFLNFITSGNLVNDIIVFNGSKINESSLNGPYVIKTDLDGNQYTYITSYYNHSDFHNEFIIEENTSVIITLGSNTVKKIKESVSGFVSNIFSDDENYENKTENTFHNKTITSENNKNSDMEKTSTLLKTDNNEKNIKSSDFPELKNNFIQNLLTGNAVLDFTDKSYNVKNNIFRMALAMMIIGVISFFLIKKFRAQ